MARKFVIVIFLLGIPTVGIGLAAWFLNPKDAWGWITLVGGMIAGWIGLLAGFAQITGRTFRDFWNVTRISATKSEMASLPVADSEPGNEAAESSVTSLLHCADYLYEINQEVDATCVKHLAGRTALASGDTEWASDLLQDTQKQATRIGHAESARRCCLDLASLHLRDGNETYAYALTMDLLHGISPSAERARAASLYGQASWQRNDHGSAIRALRRAAEDYELLAEQEMLARDTNAEGFDRDRMYYLQARDMWQAVVTSPPEPITKKDLTEARRHQRTALDAYRRSATKAKDISSFKLPELEALYFQAKEYRRVVAASLGNPSEYEWKQAKAYYLEAQSIWREVEEKASQECDHLADKNILAGDPSYDSLDAIAQHARYRTKANQDAILLIDTEIKYLENVA